MVEYVRQDGARSTFRKIVEVETVQWAECLLYIQQAWVQSLEPPKLPGLMPECIASIEHCAVWSKNKNNRIHLFSLMSTGKGMNNFRGSINVSGPSGT